MEATETTRRIERAGRFVGYGWRPHSRGGAEVYLVSSGAPLLWGLTTAQGEAIARALADAWALGYRAGEGAGIDRACEAVDGLRR